MAGLCEFLERHGGYTPINVLYASTRADLNCARGGVGPRRGAPGRRGDRSQLRRAQPGKPRDSAVSGRLLCREERQEAGPAIRRIVMLAPPNNGARFAEAFRDSSVVGWVWGDSVRQLAAGGRNPRNWRSRLPVRNPRGRTRDCGRPQSVAGRGRRHGGQRRGDQAPRRRDFAVLPDYHGKIMDDDTARKHILSFLQNGYFTSEAQRRPLPPQPAETPAASYRLYEMPAGAATAAGRALHRDRPGRPGRPGAAAWGCPARSRVAAG